MSAMGPGTSDSIVGVIRTLPLVITGYHWLQHSLSALAEGLHSQSAFLVIINYEFIYIL